jgi:hypothetical protein
MTISVARHFEFYDSGYLNDFTDTQAQEDES